MPKMNEKSGKNGQIKAYNMAKISGNEAEVNMYGEVVMFMPKDPWTGEPLSGNFIAADEFLEDLESVRNASRITVHLNSAGGDLYAGLAIYNRLKELSGEVITVNDSLAASAASLIFQAGDVRKMHTSSTLMAHGVSGMLFGFYDIDDLKALTKQFEAHNKAIVNVYATAMGVDAAEAKQFVKGETWLTGQEAIDKGLADELIEEEQEEEGQTGAFYNIMSKAADIFGSSNKSYISPVALSQVQDEQKGDTMEIKNLQDLRERYPDLVAELENEIKTAAREEGASAERQRIASIEEIENTIGDTEMVREAKYGDDAMTAEALALKAMKAQAKMGASFLNAVEEDEEEGEKVESNAAEEEEKSEEEDTEEKAKNIVDIVNKIRR